jgi:uncharacterized protein (TIGR02421 family)
MAFDATDDERCWARQNQLDVRLRRLSNYAQLLPWVTPANAASQRTQLARRLASGAMVEPEWSVPENRIDPRAWQELEQMRRLTPFSPAPELYERRLEELELDLHILQALGQPRRLRPLVVRRFGDGSTPVQTAHGERPLREQAEAILARTEDSSEPATIPATAPNSAPSLERVIRTMALGAGLEVDVRVDPRLAAGAAAGERCVLLSDRFYGHREAIRLAVHEVLGHLVSAANGRAHPIRLLELGTADSFADQEGLAIYLEEQAGTLDGHRLRTLAARVVAADRMHEGWRFGHTARELMQGYGFSAWQSVVIAERAYRGGGVARDVSYLRGWLRVRHALDRGSVRLEDLRCGRVGLKDAGRLAELRSQGFVRPPVYLPSLSSSLRSTHSGMSFETSPPREATSLTRFEAT